MDLNSGKELSLESLLIYNLYSFLSMLEIWYCYSIWQYDILKFMFCTVESQDVYRDNFISWNFEHSELIISNS